MYSSPSPSPSLPWHPPPPLLACVINFFDCLHMYMQLCMYVCVCGCFMFSYLFFFFAPPSPPLPHDPRCLLSLPQGLLISVSLCSYLAIDGLCFRYEERIQWEEEEER
jgi:hypothetical protein